MNKKRTEKEISVLVQELMNKMTLTEKIGQMFQSSYDGSAKTGPDFDNSDILKLIRDGKVGSIIGQYDNEIIYKLQENAVSCSTMKIPLLFCNDIIHGCRIIFPINLAMSCSWNMSLIKKSMRVVAYEASHSGVHLTFSPMLDLVRDPRWGRVMESNGEDPYLSSQIAKAYVKGYQGNLDSDNDIGSCAKHFVGYGACVGGRDYDSVDMSEMSLFQYYLPPFIEAIKNNVQMIMTSFNTFNGIPVTMNRYLLKEVLRKRLGFKNVIISDYTSSIEILNHKTANSLEDISYQCIKATLDHEMIGRSYIENIEKFVKLNKISEDLINEACTRVLSLKYRLGLFDNPYKNIYIDFKKYWLKPNNLKVSLKMAEESICLLENDGILPLNKKQKVAFIGPFVKEKRVIGAWGGKGETEDTVSIYEALVKRNYQFAYSEGCKINQSDGDEKYLSGAINIANESDVLVLALGEDQWMTGESHSRSDITIPLHQRKLLDELLKLNKKVILIVFSGRPLILTDYKDKVSGLIYAWFLGTMSGEALVNVIFGKTNPSGKLTMSFPYSIGQIPVYYNRLPSGRPNIPNSTNEYRLRYIDIPIEPLYPFGYGLSYSKFKYEKIQLSQTTITNKQSINVSIEITNISNILGLEIVQLYIEANNFSVSRPVKELKGFKKVSFKPNETKKVIFKLSYKDLQYYNNKFVNEEGTYKVFIGPSSNCIDFVEVKYIKS